MSENKQSTRKLPANVRVMLALCASPTLMVIGFLFYNLFTAQWQEIGISTLIFSALGLFAYTLVFTGKLPRLKKTNSSSNRGPG